MSVHAESADGKTHEFPDGTDPAVIDKVMKEYASSTAPQADPGPQAPSTFSQTIAGAGHDIAHDFSEGTQTVRSGESDVAGAGNSAAQRAKGVAKVGLGALEQIGAPVTGAAKGLVGDPIRNAVPGKGGEFAAKMAEDAAAMFGPAEVTKMAKAAVDAVPAALAAGHVLTERLGAAIPNMIKAEPRAAALQARMVGYVLPPSMASDKPGVISNALAGWSGKIKTQQAASAKNQVITNALSAQALGLPPETVLTDKVFMEIRAEAGKAYEAVKNAVPSIHVDDDFKNLVRSLGGANSQAAKHFPNITKNKDIENLVKELGDAEHFPTEAGVEVVKELRFNSNANLRAIGDPSKHALGLAQREAANAVDELMHRNIVQTAGNTPEAQKIVQNYREARKLIAKSYDVEATTNTTTGDVSARGLGRLADKGKPFTGPLKIVADTANTFPKAMQSEAAFGGNESHSALDFFGSAAALAHGNPSVAGAIMARPAARAVLLSEPYQNRMMGTSAKDVNSTLGVNP